MSAGFPMTCENMLSQLIEVVTPRAAGENRFVGRNMHPGAFRVYGGQVLAQAVGAAVATVADDRVIHSQHAYFLRPGDLGRIDPEGYLFITGRAKDLIIRGGHNIDPAIIEEALMGNDQVAFVGAIGQPDAHSGELPCAYVELRKGATVTVEDLMAFAKEHIHERAAVPKHIEILDELPKTAVGKVFKPDLRRSAITRVFNAALAEAGKTARVARVVEDKKRGLVAQIDPNGAADKDTLSAVLGQFATPWEFLPV